MIDSCRPSNAEPGFTATYSKSSFFSTSTMKSEPGVVVCGASLHRRYGCLGRRASVGRPSGPNSWASVGISTEGGAGVLVDAGRIGGPDGRGRADQARGAQRGVLEEIPASKLGRVAHIVLLAAPILYGLRRLAAC